MAGPSSNHPNDWPDDSTSFTGSLLTTSSSSTVPGPGALTGKFLKTVGERSLDLVVIMIIRNRLRSIERTLEKYPHILRNPIGEEEWKIMVGAYQDLREFMDYRSGYYSLSMKRAAARLIREITRITRPAPEFFIAASPTNKKWEWLLASIEHRDDLQTQGKVTVTKSRDAEHLGSPESPNETINVNIILGLGKQLTNGPHLIMPLVRKDLIFRGPLFKSRGRPPRVSLGGSLSRTVLLLGMTGAGKSTLMKQIQAIVSESTSKLDLKPYREAIISHMHTSMNTILNHVDTSELSEDARSAVDVYHENLSSDTNNLPHHSPGDVMTILWNNTEVRRAAHRARMRTVRDWHGLDSADYFFNAVYRILSPDYVPTLEDYVRSPIYSAGISEEQFYIDNYPWRLINPGKQLEVTESGKWERSFENSAAIVYVVSLSEYDHTYWEDSKMNHMQASLDSFKSIVRSRWLKHAMIVLLFNKVDIFKEKLKSSPLNVLFPDYVGNNWDDACGYFKSRFLSLVAESNGLGTDRPVVVKYVCAVKSDTVAEAFRSIKSEIISHHERIVTVSQGAPTDT